MWHNVRRPLGHLTPYKTKQKPKTKRRTCAAEKLKNNQKPSDSFKRFNRFPDQIQAKSISLCKISCDQLITIIAKFFAERIALRVEKIGEFPDLGQIFGRNLHFLTNENGILATKSFGASSFTVTAHCNFD